MYLFELKGPPKVNLTKKNLSSSKDDDFFVRFKYQLVGRPENPSIRNRVLCSGMLLYLHHINFKIFFHSAKFDNFKDETISDYKTVSVPQSQILAGLKTLGLVGL